MKLKYEIDPNGRHCGICNLFLPWEEYGANIKLPNGKNNKCKLCVNRAYLEKKLRNAYEERYLTKK